VKCPNCGGIGHVPGSKTSNTPITCWVCDGGRRRSPFWTPAERAGIKAMGRVSLSCIDGSFTHREPMQYAIRAYVAASRKAKKEGR